MSHPLNAKPFVEALALKGLARAGWEQRGLGDVESVAAHSWGVAWLVLTLLPNELDRDKALSYAVLHDLAEVRTGDITPQDNVRHEDKQALEAKAFGDLVRDLPMRDRLLTLYQAYEEQADPESRFVRQCDRLDMALQGAAYRKDRGLDDAEFWASANRFITEPTLRDLLEQVRPPTPEAS